MDAQPSIGLTTLDLGPAVISPALLPMRRLNRSVRLALSAFGDHAVTYEDPRGNPLAPPDRAQGLPAGCDLRC